MRKQCWQNSVRIYAEIMSTIFSKDLCGNNVDNFQKGFMWKQYRQFLVRIYGEIALTKFSKITEIKDHEGQLWKDQRSKRSNDQRSAKFKGQRSKKLTSDHKVNFPKDQRSKVQRSNQVFELSSKKNGAAVWINFRRRNWFKLAHDVFWVRCTFEETAGFWQKSTIKSSTFMLTGWIHPVRRMSSLEESIVNNSWLAWYCQSKESSTLIKWLCNYSTVQWITAQSQLSSLERRYWDRSM